MAVSLPTLTRPRKPEADRPEFDPRDLERLPALAELATLNNDLSRAEHVARLAIGEVGELRRSARSARQRLDSVPENITPAQLVDLHGTAQQLDQAAAEALTAAATLGADVAELQQRHDQLRTVASAELSGAVLPLWRSLLATFFDGADALAETVQQLESLRRETELLTGGTGPRPLGLARPCPRLVLELIGNPPNPSAIVTGREIAKRNGWL